MATTPNFPATPRSAFVNISTANTTRTATGTTNLTSLMVAGASGSRIDTILIKATSTTTAGTVRLWLYSGSGNGTLVDEIAISAITPGASSQAFQTQKSYSNFNVPSGHTIYVTTHNAESFNVFAFGGDF